MLLKTTLRGVAAMTDKDDWRLTNQEDYLFGVAFSWRKWTAPSDTWDHDNCEFGWAKFMDCDDALRYGYATDDNRHWVCTTCYQDFKEKFGWERGRS
jgi:hypothetical protein